MWWMLAACYGLRANEGAVPTVDDVILDAARVQLGMPEGRLDGSVGAFYPAALTGFVTVPLRDTERRAVAVLVDRGGSVPAPMGLDAAATRLRAFDLHNVPMDDALLPLVAAFGGAVPGWPFAEEWRVVREPSQAAGAADAFSATAQVPLDLVRWSAGGGLGPRPTPSRGGGRAPPAELGTITLRIDDAGALGWSWSAGTDAAWTLTGTPGAPPVPSDALARALLTQARTRLKSPDARPLGPPVDTGDGVWRLDMMGFGSVFLRAVPTADAARQLLDEGLWAGAEPEPHRLLERVEAAGGMPEGLLLTRLGVVESEGPWQLVAHPAGADVHYAAIGAQGLAPWHWQWRPELYPTWKPRGRVRLDARGGALRWELAVGDGTTWQVIGGG